MDYIIILSNNPITHQTKSYKIGWSAEQKVSFFNVPLLITISLWFYTHVIVINKSGIFNYQLPQWFQHENHFLQIRHFKLIMYWRYNKMMVQYNYLSSNLSCFFYM